MDAVASAAKDLVVSSDQLPALVNVVHPRPIHWRDVIENINSSLDQPLKIVPFEDWLKAVESNPSRGDSEELIRIVSTSE